MSQEIKEDRVLLDNFIRDSFNAEPPAMPEFLEKGNDEFSPLVELIEEELDMLAAAMGRSTAPIRRDPEKY